QKLPNAWGLYDMHGNVEEWCLDWYGLYPTSSVTNPTGPSTGSERIHRGGGWRSRANTCRSAFRSHQPSSDYSNSRGFRVALAPVSLNKKNIPLSDTVDLAMSMVWCPAGTFTMGSPGSELGRDSDETRHSVTISRGFGIGKYEVTQAQYRAVMGSNPSTFKGDDLPVEEVAWYDAMEFCQKLTEIERAAGRLPESYEYTLPTEAQWEYACRAGTTTALNSGKDLTTAEDEGICDNLDEVGWYWMNGGKKNWNEGKDPAICTHPGGQKQPNNWGIYDMHGNVWEWCSDWYGNYPTSSVTDPEGPGTGSYRVLRGGSWYYGADHCRSAFRGNGSPSGNNLVNIGFRVALVPVSLDKTIPLSDKVDLDMVWIEPGTFMMGSPSDELGRFSEEVRHQVTLTKDYWMGKYEVTQAQYEAVMDTNPSGFKGADLPVECVSWKDAMAFCKKLTEIEKEAGRLPEGYEYTLPTEAQWEYACRAGTTTALNSGKNLSGEYDKCPEVDEVGWYQYNSGYNSGLNDSDDDWMENGKTFPVGQKQPNAWGLYDMHGNVEEWCLDWDGDYPTSSVTDPVGPETGVWRVLRGGSWSDFALDCRSASRGASNPDFRNFDIGFRVALAPVK
ncbi:MAG: SUMF1/EgtB/PvdO family nonheme iron enzyme, partial [Verrucomicrobia bacterium]|nr:SUMF1/EgtB/PvdO family nonheme iron enzyme [Verrucomicrobiota bacterium]